MGLVLPHTRLVAWQPPEHFIVIATGPRGQGKSTLAKEYLLNVPRCPAWDPKGEFREILGGPRMTAEEFLEEAPYWKSGLLRVSVGDPITDVPPSFDKWENDFDLFMRGCWIAGHCMVVVSEITTTGASANFCPDVLKVAVNVGRDTRGLSFFLDAQRAEMMPTNIRSQASEWFAFRPVRTQDIKALQETFEDGSDGRRCDPRALPDHWFLHWTKETGAVPKILDLAA